MAKLAYIPFELNSQAVYNTSTHKIVAKDALTCNASEVCHKPEKASDSMKLWEEENCQGYETALFIGVIIGISMAGACALDYHTAHRINSWCEHPDAPIAGERELVAPGEIPID